MRSKEVNTYLWRGDCTEDIEWHLPAPWTVAPARAVGDPVRDMNYQEVTLVPGSNGYNYSVGIGPAERLT